MHPALSDSFSSAEERRNTVVMDSRGFVHGRLLNRPSGVRLSGVLPLDRVMDSNPKSPVDETAGSPSPPYCDVPRPRKNCRKEPGEYPFLDLSKSHGN